LPASKAVWLAELAEAEPWTWAPRLLDPVAQAEADGVPLDPIRYYLDCFRFGCPPHGGFGLGLTRFLVSILGLDDVRESKREGQSRHERFASGK
jgi:hypothetical protein